MWAWIASVCLYTAASFAPVGMPFLKRALVGAVTLDVAIHFGAFLCMAFLAGLAFHAGWLLTTVTAVTLLLALASELGQIHIPNRFFSLSDLIANISGCLLGTVVGIALRRLVLARDAAPAHVR